MAKKDINVGSTYVAIAATIGNNRIIKLGEQVVVKEITEHEKKSGGYKYKLATFTDGTTIKTDLFEVNFEELS